MGRGRQASLGSGTTVILAFLLASTGVHTSVDASQQGEQPTPRGWTGCLSVERGQWSTWIPWTGMPDNAPGLGASLIDVRCKAEERGSFDFEISYQFRNRSNAPILIDYEEMYDGAAAPASAFLAPSQAGAILLRRSRGPFINFRVIRLEATNRASPSAPPASPPLSPKPLVLQPLIARGDVAGLESALAKGADPNERDPQYGYTALMMAVRRQNEKIVAALLAAKARVNDQANDGYTALMFAVAANDLRLATVLLDAGANPNLRLATGVTALGILGDVDSPLAALLEARGGTK